MAAPIAPDAFSHNPERGGGVFSRVQDRIAQGSTPEGASGQEMAAKAIGKDLDVPDTRQSPTSGTEKLSKSLTDSAAAAPAEAKQSKTFTDSSLFDPEHTQSWGGRGDYHYVYTPGNPAKGTAATITLHGGKRGKAPVTIGANGQNAAAFQAILDEYKEMEAAEGVNPFMGVDKYEPVGAGQGMGATAEGPSPMSVPRDTSTPDTRESMINQAARDVMSENESAPGESAPGETSLGDKLFKEQSRMAPEPGAEGQEGMLSRIGNDLYDSMGASAIEKETNPEHVRARPFNEMDQIVGNMDNAPASTVDGANVEQQLGHLGAEDMYSAALKALSMQDFSKASEMAEGLTKHQDASMQNLGKGLQNLISMKQGT